MVPDGVTTPERRHRHVGRTRTSAAPEGPLEEQFAVIDELLFQFFQEPGAEVPVQHLGLEAVLGGDPAFVPCVVLGRQVDGGVVPRQGVRSIGGVDQQHMVPDALACSGVLEHDSKRTA